MKDLVHPPSVKSIDLSCWFRFLARRDASTRRGFRAHLSLHTPVSRIRSQPAAAAAATLVQTVQIALRCRPLHGTCTAPCTHLRMRLALRTLSSNQPSCLHHLSTVPTIRPKCASSRTCSHSHSLLRVSDAHALTCTAPSTTCPKRA